VGRLLVVRDDELEGGTKRRALPALIDDPACEYVYASSAEGFAQLAIAHAARDCGARAAIFTAARRAPHANTRAARRAGAAVYPVRPGYLAVVSRAARDYCGARPDARLLPFGSTRRRSATR
jgi:hypothetical protein